MVRLCTLTAFVLCLGWASSAFAAAPMCGPRGQSIAAPPIGTRASDASLSAGNPCERTSQPHASGASNRSAPEKLSFPDVPTRALPMLPRISTCPITGRLSSAVAEHELLATGFARSIDRPPRA